MILIEVKFTCRIQNILKKFNICNEFMTNLRMYEFVKYLKVL